MDSYVVRELTEADRPALQAYLETRLVECLFLASNLANFGLEDRDGFLGGVWLGCFSGDLLAGVAQLVNQGSLLVACSPPGGMTVLAEEVASRGYRPLRIMGMRPEVDGMLAGLQDRGSYVVREPRDSLLQVLTAETFEPRGYPGMRAATEADVPLLLDWKRRFRVEAMGDDPEWVDMQALRTSLDLTIGENRQYVFVAGDRVVSMARLNARTARMAQLGGVYTPQEERGNGYASRLLSALCEHCLGPEDLEAMALMVDVAKESANRIYRKLGFLGLWTYRFLLLEPSA